MLVFSTKACFKSLVLTVCLAVSLGISGGGLLAQPTAGEAGIGHYYAGNYEAAIEALRSALVENPKNVNLRYYLADALIKQDRLEEARMEYRRILEDVPDSKAGELSLKALSSLDSRLKRWTLSIGRVKTKDLDWDVSARIRQPDPIELQKELGSRIRLDDHGKIVSLAHLTTVKAEMAKLPSSMVAKFLDGKGEVRVVGSLMKVARTSTHNNLDAAGLCDIQPDGRIFIYLTVQALEPNPKLERRSTHNVTLHEMGHAMDFLAAGSMRGYGFSHSDEFEAVFTMPEVRQFLASMRKDGYYSSAPQEGFAEMFALYFDGDISRRQLPLAVQQYFKTMVSAEFEQ